MLAFGAPVVVEVARNGEWVPPFKVSGTVRVWALGDGQAALLLLSEDHYYALLSATKPDVRRFDVIDAEKMGPNHERNTVTHVEWLPKSDEHKGLPDKVRVRHIDLSGSDSESPQLLDLPKPPGYVSDKDCFYSKLIGHQAGIPVLRDSVCGSGRLLLSTPPRPLPDDAPVDLMEDGVL